MKTPSIYQNSILSNKLKKKDVYTEGTDICSQTHFRFEDKQNRQS